MILQNGWDIRLTNGGGVYLRARVNGLREDPK